MQLAGWQRTCFVKTNQKCAAKTTLSCICIGTTNYYSTNRREWYKTLLVWRFYRLCLCLCYTGWFERYVGWALLSFGFLLYLDWKRHFPDINVRVYHCNSIEVYRIERVRNGKNFIQCAFRQTHMLVDGTELWSAVYPVLRLPLVSAKLDSSFAPIEISTLVVLIPIGWIVNATDWDQHISSTLFGHYIENLDTLLFIPITLK